MGSLDLRSVWKGGRCRCCWCAYSMGSGRRSARMGASAAAGLPTRWVLVSVLSSVLTDDLLYVYDVLMSVEIVSGFHSSFSQFVWPAD